MSTPRAASTSPATDARSSRVPQRVAAAVGVAFTVAGAAGFVVTGFDGWTEHAPDQTLLGFAVNPLHNVVHLVIGLAGLALSTGEGRARTYGWLLAVGYGATLVYGLFVAGQAEGNLLNINTADNLLHAAAVVAGLVIALWPRGRDAGRGTATAAH